MPSVSDKVLVSVVVPIYNVERYIDRGISFLLNQVFEDFEIVLIDDGSTDGGYEKCLKWASKESQIRVFHQKNKGAGGARNTGIEKSKGKYIYFFDIDDELDEMLLSFCVDVMERKKLDLMMFGYKNIDLQYNSTSVVSFPEIEISDNESLKNIYVDQFVLKVNGFLWNKFYRKSFLNKYNIRFENQRIQQDEVFNIKVYHHLDRCLISPKVLYTYYVYDKGNTRSGFIPDRFDIYKSVREHFEDLKNFWGLKDKRLDVYLDRRFYYDVVTCLVFNLVHKGCYWSKKRKKYEIKRVIEDDLAKRALCYAEENELSVEHKLYRKAFRNESLLEISICAKAFGLMRFLHRSIRGLIMATKCGR